MNGASEPLLARRPIALVGARCVGKSTVGALLARSLELGFVDLDDAVLWAASEGCCAAHLPTINQIVEQLGWSGFRELERDELARVLASPGERVIATGGGVVELEHNRGLLRERAWCVWMRNDVALLRTRLEAALHSRPSLTGAAPADELAEIVRRREPLYSEVAHAVIDCGARSPEQLTAEIAALRRAL